MVLWLPWLLLWWFLNQILLGIDTIWPSGCLGSSCDRPSAVLYSTFNSSRYKYSSGCLGSYSGRFLLKQLYKKPPLSALAHPVLVACSILACLKTIQHPLGALAYCILWSFLMQVLIETDIKSSSSCIGSSGGRLLSNYLS